MTIEEIKLEITKASNQITLIVSDFESKTGAQVDCIMKTTKEVGLGREFHKACIIIVKNPFAKENL